MHSVYIQHQTQKSYVKQANVSKVRMILEFVGNVEIVIHKFFQSFFSGVARAALYAVIWVISIPRKLGHHRKWTNLQEIGYIFTAQIWDGECVIFNQENQHKIYWPGGVHSGIILNCGRENAKMAAKLEKFSNSKDQYLARLYLLPQNEETVSL